MITETNMKIKQIIFSIIVLINLFSINSIYSEVKENYDTDYTFPVYTGLATLQAGYRMPIGFWASYVKASPVFGGTLSWNPKWYWGSILEADFLFSSHEYTNKSGSSVSFLTGTVGPSYIIPLFWEFSIKGYVGIGGQFTILSAVKTKKDISALDPYFQIKGFLCYDLPWDLELSAGSFYGMSYESATTRFPTNFGIVGSVTYQWDPRALKAKKASLVHLVDIKTDTLFAARYSLYKDEPIIRLKVKNKSEKYIKSVRVKMKIDRIMDGPSQSIIIDTLNPKAEKDLELTSVFNSNILKFNEEQDVVAKLTLTYKIGEKDYSYSETTDLTIHGKNALSWSNINSIGSFVTHTDELVSQFARLAINGYNSVRPKGIHPKLAQAMWIFDTLGEFEMGYVSDPQAPFSKKIDNKDVIDYIFYSRETLDSKSGDCDDLTVLYASLLENISIETAVVTVPGHIFMMFNTGVASSQSGDVSSKKELLHMMNGTVWVPVETTMVGKPFYMAWEEGAGDMRKWVGSDKMEITLIRNAWHHFKPVDLGKNDKYINLDYRLARKSENKLIQADIKKLLDSGYEKQLTQYKEMLKNNPENLNAMLMIGITHARFGYLSKAKETFSAILEKDPKYLPAIINMGNIYFLNKDYFEAIKYYKMALEIKPDHPRLLINISKAYYAKKDSENSKKYYKQALIKDSKLKNQYAYLSMEEENTKKAADILQRNSTPLWVEEYETGEKEKGSAWIEGELIK